jgi:hypothetical protein
MCAADFPIMQSLSSSLLPFEQGVRALQHICLSTSPYGCSTRAHSVRVLVCGVQHDMHKLRASLLLLLSCFCLQAFAAIMPAKQGCTVAGYALCACRQAWLWCAAAILSSCSAALLAGYLQAKLEAALKASCSLTCKHWHHVVAHLLQLGL